MTFFKNCFSHAISIAAVALLAGCGSPDGDTTGGSAESAMPGMPNMPRATEEPLHVAQGTVNSIDQAAGTVNISHGPVASASWPAMTMSFKLANPSSVSGIAPGQRVEFQFTIAGGMDATVAEIKRVE
jgi:Cu(I)/Ag(I) efflux system membrane fusion protein